MFKFLNVASLKLALCICLTLSTPATASTLDTILGLEDSNSKVKIEKGLSDHTANVDPETNLIYITGGCDASDGNVFSNGYFQCLDCSDSLYSFDATKEEVKSLSKMPVERYRHAAVLVNQHLWVLGGRDKFDAIPPMVDVFDINADTWTSYNLSSKYHLSDHGAFPDVETGHAYFCGGYNISYAAFAACFSIDTKGTLENSDKILQIIDRRPMSIPRGDISVASSAEGAIVTGGFSDLNEFCEPYGETEQYTFATDSWITTGTMNSPRGDMALVYVDDLVFALGGEREIPSKCEINTTFLGPDQLRLTVDDVEVYNLTSKLWTVLDDLPNGRFRFAAVSTSNENNTIVAFGGQTSFNASCNCTDGSDEITFYNIKYDMVDKNTGGDSTTSNSSTGGNSTTSNSSFVCPRSMLEIFVSILISLCFMGMI